MGHSEWGYYVPYQEDIYHALDDLRNEIFAKGEYYKGVTYDEQGHVRVLEANEVPEDWPSPSTIDELLTYRGYKGTHSILDVTWISLTTPDGQWSPHLSVEQAQHYSTRPGYRFINNPGLSQEYTLGPSYLAEVRAFAMFPVPKEALLAIFGTARPTEPQLAQHFEEVRDRFCSHYYVVAYEASRDGEEVHPVSIYFHGITGD